MAKVGVAWHLESILAFLLALGTPIKAEIAKPSDIYWIDGDTLKNRGVKYRLVGFDTPETFHAKCDYELALGNAATDRARTLTNSGQHLDLIVLPGKDKYGRGLARILIGGVDLSDILVSEGLARRYSGGKRTNWC